MPSHDDIDWSALEHAYGPATDVPGQLAALERGTPAERKAALWALFGNIYHQGTRYPATAPAVGELVHIASAVPELWKAQIYGLVTACVTGWMSITAGPYTVAGAPWSASELGDDRSMIADIERAAAPLVVDAIASLGASPRMRTQAAYLLAAFRGRTDVVDALQSRWHVEKDPRARATIAFALGHTLPLGDDGVLLAALEGDEPLLVRVVVAMLLARRMGPSTPMRAIALLAEALAGDPRLEQQYARLPWQSEGLAGDIAEVMQSLGRDVLATALPAIECRLAEVSDFAAVGLLNGALTAVFGDAPAPKDAAALADAQRRLLLTLVANDAGFWTIGNALSELGDRGLPSMRSEMASWLGVTYHEDPAMAAVRHAEMLRDTFHDVDGAQESLVRALQAAPEHPRLLLELALCAAEAGHDDHARTIVDAALLHDPSLGRAHFLAAELAMRAGDGEAAVAAFLAASEHLDPQQAVTARNNAATLMAQMGDRDACLALERQTTERFPDIADSWYARGLSEVKARRFAESIASIERLLALEPEHGNGHYTIACAYALRDGSGDRDAALHHVEEALAADPELAAAIAEDEDFTALRDDPRFRTLVRG